MLMIVMFKSIPDLNRTLSDFKVQNMVYQSFKIDSLKRETLFSTTYDRTLILKMTDGSKWNISRVYSKYFDELKDKKNIGKKYSLYVHDDDDNYPSQVLIENKMVYSIKENTEWNYILILLFLVLVYFCVSAFRENNIVLKTK